MSETYGAYDVEMKQLQFELDLKKLEMQETLKREEKERQERMEEKERRERLEKERLGTAAWTRNEKVRGPDEIRVRL